MVVAVAAAVAAQQAGLKTHLHLESLVSFLYITFIITTSTNDYNYRYTVTIHSTQQQHVAPNIDT